MNAETRCCNSRTLSLCEKFIAATPSGHFEQARRPLATANAHRHDHEPRAAALAFDECVTREACAADAIGMADRNRAAVDVQALVRNAEAISAIQHLASECFIELPEIDVDRKSTRLNSSHLVI